MEAHHRGAGRPHRCQVPAPGVAPPSQFFRRGAILLKHIAVNRFDLGAIVVY